MQIAPQGYTGFVYLWFDKKRKWFCIGSHMGTLNDGYVTSTGWMTRAYEKRPQDFKRRILYWHFSDDKKQLLKKEQYFLDMVKEHELQPLSEDTGNVSDRKPRYYNMKKNASGMDSATQSIKKHLWWNDPVHGEERKLQQKIKFETNNPVKPGNVPWNKGQSCPSISESRLANPTEWTEDMRAHRAELTKQAWDQGVYANRPPPTKEAIEKAIASRRAASDTWHSEETRKKIGDKHRGKVVSATTRANMSEAAKNRPAVSCPHCGHTGRGPQMYRYHFNNCKHS